MIFSFKSSSSLVNNSITILGSSNLPAEFINGPNKKPKSYIFKGLFIFFFLKNFIKKEIFF